jgi:hypothetical protein
MSSMQDQTASGGRKGALDQVNDPHEAQPFFEVGESLEFGPDEVPELTPDPPCQMARGAIDGRH